MYRCVLPWLGCFFACEVVQAKPSKIDIRNHYLWLLLYVTTCAPMCIDRSPGRPSQYGR